MEGHQRELHKEERQHEVHKEGGKTGYTAMERRQRELHKEDGRLGRLQGKDISVSYTRKTGDWGDCKGKTSA